MRKKKTFDCVEMKRALQARVLGQRRRLGDAEYERRHREWLETSDDSLARWWRKVTAKLSGATEVREKPEN